MKRLTTTTSRKKNMIGAKVKQFRLEQHLSRQMLSNKLETEAIYVCRGSISRIEDGSRTVSDLELYGLSKVLNKPIEDFLRSFLLKLMFEYYYFLNYNSLP